MGVAINDDKVVRIRFGVEGGSSLDTGSGQQIKNELTEIAKRLDLKVTINVNQEALKNQLTKAKQNINKALSKGVNIKLTTGSAASSNTGETESIVKNNSKIVASYETTKKALINYYNKKKELLSYLGESSVFNKGETSVKGVEATDTFVTAQSEYEQQYNALIDRQKELETRIKSSSDAESDVTAELQNQLQGINEQINAIDKLKDTLATAYENDAYKQVARSLETKNNLQNQYNKASTEDSSDTAQLRLQLDEAAVTSMREMDGLLQQDETTWKNIAGEVERYETELNEASTVKLQNLHSAKEISQVYSSMREKMERMDKLQKELDKTPDSASEKYKSLSARISEVRTSIEEMNAAANEEYGTSWEAKEKELLQYSMRLRALRSDQNATLNASNADKMATSMKNSFQGVIANAQSLIERYQDLAKYSKEAADIIKSLRDITKQQYYGEDYVDEEGTLKEADFAKTKKQISDTAISVKKFSGELSKLNAQTNTLKRNFLETLGSNTLHTITYSLITLAQQGLRQVYQNVVKLDGAVTDLQIATGKTREETEELVDTYADLAKRVGSTVTETTEAADTWLRQGYEVSETNELITDTLMLSKLGQLSSTEAADALTSAMKGYKLEVSDCVNIVDKLTAVDMEAAVSSGDIATAMAETAASAEVAGVSMDKLIGYISTVSEVTQDGAESVGNFYKTLFARMGNVKAGADVDDEGESLSDVETVLRSLDISLRDTEGNFRDFDTVLDEVAASWENYTNVQQHQIATAFAGTRQQEKFIVLMENYGTALEYATTAAESAGTATQKYSDAYLNSIEASLDKLTATFQEFSMTLLDSDLVKTIINIGQIALNVINAILSIGDGIPVKVGLITAAAIALEAVLIRFQPQLINLGKQIKLFVTQTGAQLNALKSSLAAFVQDNAATLILSGMVTLISLMSQFGDTAKGASEIAIGAITIAAVIAIASIKNVDSVVKAFQASNPIGWIITALAAVVSLIKGIVDLVNSFSYDSLKEKADEAKDAWQETNDELEDTKTQLEDIQKQIDEINAKDKITLSDQEDLATLKAQREELQSIEDIQERQAQREKEEAAKATAEAIDAYNNQYTYDDAQINVLRGILTLGISYAVQGATDGFDDYQAKIERIFNDYANASDSEKEFVDNYILGLKENLDGFAYGDDEALDTYFEDYWYKRDRWNLLNGAVDTVWKSLQVDPRFTEEMAALKKLANNQEVTIASVIANAPKLTAYLSKIGYDIENDTENGNAFVNTIKALREGLAALSEVDITDDLETMQNRFDALKNSLEDIAELGYVGADNLETLLSDYADIAEKYFDYVDRLGYKIKDEFAGLSTSEVLMNFATDALQEYVDTYIEAVALYRSLSEDDDDKETALKNAETALDNLNKKIAEWATILREVMIDDETDKLEDQKDALEDLKDSYKDLIDVRKDLLETYEEEVEYRKELAQKQQTVATLQTQLALAKLDKTAAGQARVRELEDELDDAVEELDDYTLEHAINDLTKQLDDNYTEYEKFIDKEVTKLQSTIDSIAASVNEKIQEAMSSIVNVINENSINDAKNTDDSNNGDDNDEFVEALKEANNLVAGVKNVTKKQSYQSELNTIIDEQDLNKLKEFISDVTSYLNGVARSPVTVQIHEAQSGAAGGVTNATTGGKGSGGKFVFDRIYHSGGIVGDETKLKSNEEFAKLLKGEFVATPKMMDSFIKTTLPAIANSASGSNNVGITIDNLLTVQGNVSEDALPDLETILNKAVDKMQKVFKSSLSRSGYSKNY